MVGFSKSVTGLNVEALEIKAVSNRLRLARAYGWNKFVIEFDAFKVIQA